MAGSALHFPYDKRDHYKGRITFKVYRTQTPNVSLGGLEDLLSGLMGEFAESTSTETATGGTAAGGGGGGADAGGAAGTTGGPPGTGTASSAEFENPAVGGTATRAEYRSINSGAGSVSLYLPQSINIPDGVSYEQVELGMLGGMVESAIKSGMSPTGALGQSINNQISSMVNLLRTNPAIATDAAKLAAVRVASKIGGEVGGNVAGSVFRTSVNPQRRQMFRGVNMREFGFTFKMIANSPREAQEIDNIIKFFRRELYPESFGAGELIGEAVGYKFPEPFNIDMTYNGKRVATKLAPAYLRMVDVVYNPSSMGFHVDGKPSEVDLRLTFVEERTLDRQAVLDGY